METVFNLLRAIVAATDVSVVCCVCEIVSGRLELAANSTSLFDERSNTQCPCLFFRFGMTNCIAHECIVHI